MTVGGSLTQPRKPAPSLLFTFLWFHTLTVTESDRLRNLEGGRGRRKGKEGREEGGREGRERRERRGGERGKEGGEGGDQGKRKGEMRVEEKRGGMRERNSLDMYLYSLKQSHQTFRSLHSIFKFHQRQSSHPISHPYKLIQHQATHPTKTIQIGQLDTPNSLTLPPPPTSTCIQSPIRNLKGTSTYPTL